MFKVCEFNDSSVAVVRDDWLTPNKKQCSWPPYKSAIKVNKCLTLSSMPKDEEWPIYKVRRIMFETNDLQIAREKCRQAESDSELVSEAEQEKKRRKKRNICPSSDTDEDEHAILSYPSPPKGKVLADKDIIQHKPQEKSIQSSTQLSQLDDLNELNSTKSYIVDSPHSGNQQKSKKARLLLENFTVDSPSSCRTPSSSPTSSRRGALEQINASLESIASYMANIKCDVQQLKATQNDILVRLASSTTLNKIALPDGLTLPLNSVEDLNSMGIWLESEDNQKNLINNLSIVGGNNIATITRRILQRLFSTSLAVKCNWTGKNNKYSLKKNRVTEVIIHAVRGNNLAEKASESDIINALTSWFRFARDRDGGRENRRSHSTQDMRE